MPKISIIVPIYIDFDYKKEYLITCLDSLVNQSLKDIEIICINDHSPINIDDVLSRYPNIKVINNEENLGQSKSRNKGLDVAQGEYITFVDSDDYVNLDMYQKLYEAALENNHPDLIETGITFVKDDSFVNKDHSGYYSKPRLLKPNEQRDNLIYISPSTCNKLWKRSLVNNTRFINTKMWEDYAFTFSLYMEAESVLNSSNGDYYYRKSATDTVSAKSYYYNNDFTDIFVVVEEILRHAKPEYSEQVSLLKFGLILGRILEISRWPNATDELKETIKKRMFDETYQRYGAIPEDMDIGLLSMLATVSIIDEYRTLYPTKKR